MRIIIFPDFVYLVPTSKNLEYLEVIGFSFAKDALSINKSN